MQCSAQIQQSSWVRLPFFGRQSYKLALELRRLGYNSGFYPLYTVGQLSTLKDPLETLEKSGIYRVSCGDCNSIYIGQTGRKLETRFNEHKTKKNSAVLAHCTATGHHVHKSSIALLHQCSGGQRMNRQEEVETIKAPNNMLLNDSDSIFYNYFIRHYFDDSPSYD